MNGDNNIVAMPAAVKILDSVTHRSAVRRRTRSVTMKATSAMTIVPYVAKIGLSASTPRTMAASSTGNRWRLR